MGAKLAREHTIAAQYFAIARQLASNIFDEPTEETICGLALMTTYCFGTNDIAKGHSYLSLAIALSGWTDLSPETLISLALLKLLGYPPDIPKALNDSILDLDLSTLSPYARSTYYVIQSLRKDSAMDPLEGIDEALNILHSHPSHGGEVRFLNELYLYGLKALIQFKRGQMSEAVKYAKEANKNFDFSKAQYCCPFMANFQSRLTYLYYQLGDSTEFVKGIQRVEAMSGTWEVKFPLEKLQRKELEGNPTNYLTNPLVDKAGNMFSDPLSDLASPKSHSSQSFPSSPDPVFEEEMDFPVELEEFAKEVFQVDAYQ